MSENERRCAIVTGAGRGIGRAVAVRLAKDGFDVVVNCAHSEDAARETASVCEAYGVRALVVRADVSDQDGAKKLFDETIAAFGRVDVLVNNAGITRDGLLLRMKPEDFDAVQAKDEFTELYLVNTKIPMSIKFSTTPTLVGLPAIREDIEKNVANNEKSELSFLDKENQVEIEIVPIAPQVVNASAQDSKEIAEKILEYINSYRTIKAIKLEGLTEYAEYRSRQLIKRFAHNTEDERAAATALQYGEYVDPSLYGMNGEPYYTSCSREAIAKAGYAGTVDEIAKRFADLIKNSAKHWAYVGADEYSYIAVGVTYESGMWYCDVAVTSENTDNK